jgi:hypothetical protein
MERVDVPARGSAEQAGALRVAELALAVAERLSPDELGTAWVADARALAASAVGGLHRVLGQLAEAELLLARSEREALRGTGDPQVLAGILLERSLLARQLGEDELAETQLGTAVALLARQGDRSEEGAAILLRAEVLQRLGREDEALQALEAAREALEAARRCRS